MASGRSSCSSRRCAPHVERLVLVGRLDPRPGRSHYALCTRTPSSSACPTTRACSRRCRSRARCSSRSSSSGGCSTRWTPSGCSAPIRTRWRSRWSRSLRRRRLVLGVRQDMPAYVRSRRPDRRWMHVSADVLEAIWRLLARRHAVVVVGPELARKYRRARGALQAIDRVAGARARSGDAADAVAARSYDGELTVLTVGRLDAEKNPLLLADIMARWSPATARGGWWSSARAPRRRALAAPAGRAGACRAGGAARLCADRRRPAGPLSDQPRLPARLADRGFSAGSPSRRSRPACRRSPRRSGACRPAAAGAALLVAPGDADRGHGRARADRGRRAAAR